MLIESIDPSQQAIAESLQPNDQTPYRRIIDKVRWISPVKLPYVFHTASKEFGTVEPAFCQSFDYKLFGQVIPVTYVLPWIHINRVKGVSEVWGRHKQEGFEQSGLPYTYLRLSHNDQDFGQIRMGSSMLDQYLLAAKNSGQVFVVYLTEISQSGLRSKMKEFISLANLPVIDSYKFREPSPIGIGMGGGRNSFTYGYLPTGICRLPTIYKISGAFERLGAKNKVN